MGGSPISGHLPVIRCLPTVASSGETTSPFLRSEFVLGHRLPRVMIVRAGVTVYTRGTFCNDADLGPFLSVFSLCGHCEEIPEKHIDAFTAFSGSGVAFVSYTTMSLTKTFKR